MRAQQQGLQTVRASGGNRGLQGRHQPLQPTPQGCAPSALEALRDDAEPVAGVQMLLVSCAGQQRRLRTRRSATRHASDWTCRWRGT
jgi:hypothetical protein